MHSVENRYPGVNAHLNGLLQREGWEGFHAEFVAAARTALDEVLPPGYVPWRSAPYSCGPSMMQLSRG